MPQKQHYLTNTYQSDITTTVTDSRASVDGFRICLMDNIFHPQGGGQPADQGTVNNITAVPVRDINEPDSVLLELLSPDPYHCPEPGEQVHAQIDLEQRKFHAALHTAGHLVDALVRRSCSKARHHSNNHFPEQARIEYTIDPAPIDKTALAATLQDNIDDALTCAANVFSSYAEGSRTVTIDGFGTDFCGGTHVDHLGLLDEVLIRSVKVKSGKLRVGYSARHK